LTSFNTANLKKAFLEKNDFHQFDKSLNDIHQLSGRNSLIIMKNAMAIINQPKPFLSLILSTFLLKYKPKYIPPIAIAVKINRKFHLIGCRPKSPKNPIREFNAIIIKEVPMASLMGRFIKITRAGTSKKPPPAPRNPVTSPIPNPNNI